MKYLSHGDPVSKMMADGLSHGPGYVVLLCFGGKISLAALTGQSCGSTLL